MDAESHRASHGTGAPADSREWKRGVVYTVRRRLLSRLRSGQTYKLNVQVQRIVAPGGSAPPNAALYTRAQAIARARIEEIARAEGKPLGSWIHSHFWGSGSGVAGAFLTTAFAVSDGAMELPTGEVAPTPEELDMPRIPPPTVSTAEANRQWAAETRAHDEIYKDLRGETSAATLLFSYGESVSRCLDLDLEPVVERAMLRARWHHVHIEGRPAPDFAVRKRDSWCIADTALAVVQLHCPLSRD